MLVDSHCHLPLILERGVEIDQILENAKQAAVSHMLCVAVDLDSFPEILALSQKYPHVYGSVGIHPNTEVKIETTVDELISLASDSNIIAIGETGLDYFRSEGDLQWQHDRFVTHIEAAKATQKPLIIHTRDSGEDTISLLKENHADQASGVMHCFVDTYEIAKKALDLGFYISLSGIVTFKNAQQVQEVAKKIPLDRMLVETDSPYLAPVPHRGKTNEPAFVTHVAQFIAELRGVDQGTLIETTTNNFFELFNTAVPVN